MQITEILEGIGVAIFTGTTVTDQKCFCNVGERCQWERGLSNVLAEAADCFLSVHVTLTLVAVRPKWAAEARPRVQPAAHFLQDWDARNLQRETLDASDEPAEGGCK